MKVPYACRMKIVRWKCAMSLSTLLLKIKHKFKMVGCSTVP